MTGTELDDIMSDSGQEAVVEQQEQAITPDAPKEGANRDEHGRFAPKQVEEQHEDVAKPERGGIPPAVASQLRGERREARQEADTVKQENETLKSQLARLEAQIGILAQQRQEPKPAAEPAKAPDFWENPDDFVSSKLSSVQQQLAQQSENFSRLMAVKDHGQEKVDGAYQAMAQKLMAHDPSARAEYQRIMASPHMYDALVEWHNRSQAMERVGSDPDAWLESELEKRLADPAYQAKVLERIQGAAAATNRSHPVTKLPPSLSRIPSGSSHADDDGDMSDGAIFRSATR